MLKSVLAIALLTVSGDLFGRKPVFQFAIAVFLPRSRTVWVGELDAGTDRVSRGAGHWGGGLMVGAQAIIGDLVSPRERGRYIGLIVAVFMLASIVGPLMGGFLLDEVSW